MNDESVPARAEVHAAYRALRTAQTTLVMSPALLTQNETAILNLKPAERLLAAALGLPVRTDA